MVGLRWWSGVLVGQGPGPNCRRVEVDGSRVEHVWSCMVRDKGFGTAEAVLFYAQIWECRAGANKNRASPAETPQHYHLTTASRECQLQHGEKLGILPFIPFNGELFVGNPVL